MTKCKSCGKEIVWAYTRSGKKIPLEVRSRGNVSIRDGVAKVGAEGAGNYIAHFATCPHGNAWRRR